MTKTEKETTAMENSVNRYTKTVRRYGDERLDKELAFARAFAPPVSEDERQWLDALEQEQKRRKR